MNKVERAGAPAVGNAIGYFFVLWLTPKVLWLEPSDESMAVAFAGTIFIHLFSEVRNVARWSTEQYRSRK